MVASIERINPEGLLEPVGFTHAVRVSGGTTIYVSGQGAYTADHVLVGPGDYYEQSKQAFTNVLHALRGAGATFQDVVKATYLVVDLNPTALEGFVRAMNEVLGPDAVHPAATLIGVQALGYPEMLVEFEVVAVV
ncbi:MAG: enamine deaminase RidA [Acidimicrobiia bacterium]